MQNRIMVQTVFPGIHLRYLEQRTSQPQTTELPAFFCCLKLNRVINIRAGKRKGRLVTQNKDHGESHAATKTPENPSGYHC